MQEKIKTIFNLNTQKRIKTYNLFVLIFVWIFFIWINVAFWEDIINFIFKFSYGYLTYTYILIIFPGLLSGIIYLLTIIEGNRKKTIFYLIILPLIFYYLLFIVLTIYIYI